jgi:L-cysteate sulfo-lyase
VNDVAVDRERMRRLGGLLAERGALGLARYPSPVEPLSRLREALGAAPRLLVKRDDALSFGFGGSKVRKLELVVARALAEGADTLVTVGGVQSNHARCTAAFAARMGLGCALVLNGARPERPSGNALLSALYGARVHYVASREEREPAMQEIVERLRREGSRPFAIPLGCSTPLGVLGLAAAVAELLAQIPAPDVIVHATSSGGTQAGLVAGCALAGLPTRVIGISADDPSPQIERSVRGLAEAALDELGAEADVLDGRIQVDDGHVGDGYGIPTPASEEAQRLAARTEALALDPTYTAKAMAGLIAWQRAGRFGADESVLFWHTGGSPSLFA